MQILTNVLKIKYHVVPVPVVPTCPGGLNVHVQCLWLEIRMAHLDAVLLYQFVFMMLIVNLIKNATLSPKNVMVI